MKIDAEYRSNFNLLNHVFVTIDFFDTHTSNKYMWHKYHHEFKKNLTWKQNDMIEIVILSWQISHTTALSSTTFTPEVELIHHQIHHTHIQNISQFLSNHGINPYCEY